MIFQIEDRGNGIKWVQIDRTDMRDIARWWQEKAAILLLQQ